MKALATVFVMSMMAFQPQSLPDKEVQIAGALQAAPEGLREGATVYGYDSEGKITLLQQGDGMMICLADNPHQAGFTSSAFHKSLYPFMVRGHELRMEGKSAAEVFEIREAEAKSGELKMPEKGTTLYVLSGEEGAYDPNDGIVTNVKARFVVYVPWATAATTGLSTSPEAAGTPWLMDPGTHRAHIMIIPPGE